VVASLDDDRLCELLSKRIRAKSGKKGFDP